MNKPISPEQREELLDWAEYRKENSETARNILLLLSNEQAWKEEAAKQYNEWSKVAAEYCEKADLLQEQLNQAVEVLKWIRDAGTDYQSINKARDFLSSLSQKEETT